MQSLPKALVSWSSGKDSAWTLAELRASGRYDVVGLLTTINEAFARVAMHGVRRELVEVQAAAANVPLWPLTLPWPCSDHEYELRMRAFIEDARRAGVSHCAFGDLFLEDIRAHRIDMLDGSGIEALFPIWCGGEETEPLARALIDAGTRAIVSCVDTAALDASFVGREFDHEFIDDLPAGVDRLGEHGEFHTFCYAGPAFETPLSLEVGEVVDRDGFVFVDITPG